jgi:hypothetical protein
MVGRGLEPLKEQSLSRPVARLPFDKPYRAICRVSLLPVPFPIAMYPQHPEATESVAI